MLSAEIDKIGGQTRIRKRVREPKMTMDDDIEDILHKHKISFINWVNECINYLENSQYGLLSISNIPFNTKLSNNLIKKYSIGV